MPVPLRNWNLDYATKYPRAIIIHSTQDLNLGSSSVERDTGRFQTGDLEKLNFQINKQSNTNFHYVVEKMPDNDYHVVLQRPLFTNVDYDDLAPYYKNSIHIGLMGDYNKQIAQTRLYQVLAFRAICPLLRMFRLTVKDIFTHSELSLDLLYEDRSKHFCPGPGVDPQKMRAYVRAYLRRVPIVR